MHEKDSKFLYDIAFGLAPFHVEQNHVDQFDAVIYDEEDDVHEMYFVTEGVVGIGYYIYSQGLSSAGGGRSLGGVKLGMFVHEGAFICDYYACCDRRAEFVHVAASPQVTGFSLTKRFLLKELFPRYPEEANTIRTQSFMRYRTNIRKRLQKHREQHLREVNKKSTYKAIEVNDKSNLKVSADGNGIGV
jgi:hypothetical protein